MKTFFFGLHSNSGTKTVPILGENRYSLVFIFETAPLPLQISGNAPANAGDVGVFIVQNLEATVLGKNDFKPNCEDIWFCLSDKISTTLLY